MNSLVSSFLTLVEALLDQKMARRRLVMREARTLIGQTGAAAFDNALQVANLARERGDERSTELWLDIAREIAQQETPKQRDVPSR